MRASRSHRSTGSQGRPLGAKLSEEQGRGRGLERRLQVIRRDERGRG